MATYSTVASMLERLAVLRRENEGIYPSEKDEMPNAGDDGEEKSEEYKVEAAVFERMERMAEVLCTCPRPLEFSLDTRCGGLILQCGTLNPHITYQLCGFVDNGLAGFVMCDVGDDDTMLHALVARGQPEYRPRVVTYLHADVDAAAVARAFVDAVARVVIDRAPHTRETWEAEYEANRCAVSKPFQQ